MKKRLLPLLLALLFTLSACGGAGSGDASSASAAAGDMSMDTNGWAESADTADGGSADFSAVRQNAKLILRADLTLETQNFDAASADLEKLTAETGGYIESSSLSGDKGSRSAYYTLRIPQEKFETFYAQLGDRAHVVYSSRSSEDITEQYTDIETRGSPRSRPSTSVCSPCSIRRAKWRTSFRSKTRSRTANMRSTR